MTTQCYFLEQGLLLLELVSDSKKNPDHLTDAYYIRARKIPKIYEKTHEQMTFQNKGFGEMPSARLDSHRNSVQNGMVESSGHFTGTIFVNFFDFSKIDQNFTRNRPEIDQNLPDIDRKSIGNRPEIDRKSSGNRPEIDGESTENRPEVGDHFLCP